MPTIKAGQRKQLSFIENSIQVKDYAFVAFLDIEGAFNNIMPSVITVALTRHGIDHLIVGLINQLLKCRPILENKSSL